MSLNIKNERVHALAREAARLTGKNQTSVIEEALEKLLAELSHAKETQRRHDLIRAIQADLASTPAGITIEDLYDEDGLPA